MRGKTAPGALDPLRIHTKQQHNQVRKSIKPAKPRPTLQPGAILILLAGRFRGKRVILLKHLSQGVLLVTGPFKVNGVPLRRVNARYVIATSSKVELKGIDEKTVEKVGEEGYFTREKKQDKAGEEAFFKQGEKPEVSDVFHSETKDGRCGIYADLCGFRRRWLPVHARKTRRPLIKHSWRPSRASHI